MRKHIVALAAALFLASNSTTAEQTYQDAMKEFININKANDLYMQKHPHALRPQGASINKVLEAMAGVGKPKPQIYNNDQDPKINPEQWDRIESTSKICWFHKGTRRKVCENK